MTDNSPCAPVAAKRLSKNPLLTKVDFPDPFGPAITITVGFKLYVALLQDRRRSPLLAPISPAKTTWMVGRMCAWAWRPSSAAPSRPAQRLRLLRPRRRGGWPWRRPRKAVRRIGLVLTSYRNLPHRMQQENAQPRRKTAGDQVTKRPSCWPPPRQGAGQPQPPPASPAPAL